MIRPATAADAGSIAIGLGIAICGAVVVWGGIEKTLAGHPAYQVTGSSVLFKDQDLLAMEPEERARAGKNAWPRWQLRMCRRIA